MIELTREANGDTLVKGVEHVLVVHSPDGFEWGYMGSGPAELALNILHRLCKPSERDKWYQQFKEDVISKIPYEGGVIEEKDIYAWLSGKRESEI